MSYGITITVKDNFATVSGQTNEVPEGTFQVSGHDDANGRAISVYRTRQDETAAVRLIATASGFGAP